MATLSFMRRRAVISLNRLFEAPLLSRTFSNALPELEVEQLF